MKFLQLLSLLIFLAPTAYSQISNTTAVTASFISESDETIIVNYTDDRSCNEGIVKMYYYYIPNETHASGNLFTVVTGSSSTVISSKAWEFDTKAQADLNYAITTPLATSSGSGSITVAHALTGEKVYLLELSITACTETVTITSLHPDYFSDDWSAEDCQGCLSGFDPPPGIYIVSAWVRDPNAAPGTLDYTAPQVVVESGNVQKICRAKGEIIDGWQRVEEEVVVVPDGPVEIKLYCGNETSCFFDDIRFFPKDGSMVTYVYDPQTLRLMAELDERNYAKIYEYDEQGKLTRVKKETEMGIMTIQENRENNAKE